MTVDARPVWVLGGGGIAGIAWEMGMLAGLAEEGVTVDAGSVVIGTSAGAIVGARAVSGIPIRQLFDRESGGIDYETAGPLRLRQLLTLATAQLFARTPERAAQRIGARALAATVDDPSRQLRVAAARLPVHEWPDADLRITTVDAVSGELRVFARGDAATLVEAVAASSAVPLSSLPVLIGGHHYMDGGMRSTVNLDLAPGRGPVIALAPSTASITPWARLARQRAALGPTRTVEILEPDAASRHARGRDVMNFAAVPQLMAAALQQGRREAVRIAAALGT